MMISGRTSSSSLFGGKLLVWLLVHLVDLRLWNEWCLLICRLVILLGGSVADNSLLLFLNLDDTFRGEI